MHMYLLTVCVKMIFKLQAEGADEFIEKQKKDAAILKDVDLSQFSIRGSEDDWKKALTSGKGSSLVSIKR